MGYLGVSALQPTLGKPLEMNCNTAIWREKESNINFKTIKTTSPIL